MPQVAAGDVPHGDVEDAVRLARLEDRHDVRVVDRGGHPGLVGEAAAGRCRCGPVRGRAASARPSGPGAGPAPGRRRPCRRGRSRARCGSPRSAARPARRGAPRTAASSRIPGHRRDQAGGYVIGRSGSAGRPAGGPVFRRPAFGFRTTGSAPGPGPPSGTARARPGSRAAGPADRVGAQPGAVAVHPPLVRRRRTATATRRRRPPRSAAPAYGRGTPRRRGCPAASSSTAFR